jgi:hypothetical protein
MAYVFSVTYETVTEESAEQGDFEEIGFYSQNVSLRDAIKDVMSTRTNRVDGVERIEPSDSRVEHARWITVHNGMEYETGARESRSLHFPDNLSGSSRRRIARLLGVNVR